MFLRGIIIVSVTLVIIVFIRCRTKSDAEIVPVLEKSNEFAVLQVPEQLKSNCYICHNPNAPSHDAIIAPPLAIVKMRYLRQYRTKKGFVEGMTFFITNPTKETAIMYGAVDRFGVMAKSVLDEKTIREIVEYIYSNKLEEPSWLKEQMGNRVMQ